MIRSSAVFTVFALASMLCCPAYAQEKGQVVEGDVLKDMQYGFILKRPSPAWQILDEKSAKKLNADSVAGLVNPRGMTYALVIPEQAPGSDLSSYADLILGNMALEEKLVVERKEVTLGGGKAMRLEVHGKTNGLKFIFRISIFRRGDFYFQLLTWWLAASGKADRGEIERIHSGFGFIEGVIPSVRAVKREESFGGLGWRVEKDLYEHGIYGFRYRLLSKGFRYMGETELRQVNAEASLGMENASAGLYTVVIAEKIGDMGREAYEKLIVGNFENGNTFAGQARGKVPFAGGEIIQHRFKEVALEGGMKADFFLVVVSEGKVGAQIMSWCVSGMAEKGAVQAAVVPGGFSWMTAERKAEVLPVLRRQADELRSVSGQESYRNRRFTHYGCGFTLALPPGFWSHAIGTEARQQNESASLLLNNLEHDMNVVVILEDAEEFTAEAYHAAVREAMQAPEKAAVRTLDVKGLEVHSSRWSEEQAGQLYTYHIATARAGKVHAQLLLYGLETNLRHTASLEEAVIKGLGLTGLQTPPVQWLAGGRYVNNAIGFRVDPPDRTWALKDMTPPVLGGMGVVIQMVKRGEKMVCLAGAVHSGHAVEDLIVQMMDKSPVFEEAGLRRILEMAFEWLDRPARKLRYVTMKPGSDMKLEMVVTSIGGTQYFLTMVSGKDSDPWEAMKDCVKLLP